MISYVRQVLAKSRKLGMHAMWIDAYQLGVLAGVEENINAMGMRREWGQIKARILAAE